MTRNWLGERIIDPVTGDLYEIEGYNLDLDNLTMKGRVNKFEKAKQAELLNNQCAEQARRINQQLQYQAYGGTSAGGNWQSAVISPNTTYTVTTAGTGTFSANQFYTTPPTPTTPTMKTTRLINFNDWTIATQIDQHSYQKSLVAFNSAGKTVQSSEHKLILDGTAFYWDGQTLWSGKVHRVSTEIEKTRLAEAKAAARKAARIAKLAEKQKAISNQIEKIKNND